VNEQSAPLSVATPVLILTGPPGVGKTTTAAALADRHPASVHLEADTFFRFIHSGYVDPWRPESHGQNSTVMEIVAAAAAAYADAGYFTIIDGIVIPGRFLEPVRDRLQAGGHEVAFVVARAPQEICAERLLGREGVDVLGGVDQVWAEFADLGPLESHAVEVVDLSPEQAADAIERLLASGSLTV